jgi:serine/threonine protein kinase
MKIKNEIIELDDDVSQNYISLDNEDYILLPLSNGKKRHKGASSNIFILNDPNGETEDRVIKICKSDFGFRDRRFKRFNREIRAFKEVKKKRVQGIIHFYKDGIADILGYKYPCIVLEKAQSDLATYLELYKFNFTINQKLGFCISILNSFKQLHSIDIYHRDIKADNILIVNDELKIGDLGLVAFQNRDYSMDFENEKIGPFGWLSPEATNKMLTENKKINYSYDCIIDSSSDIFQLGKLFWYIFQGNLPLGQIVIADFQEQEQDIFEIIFAMLCHSKERRPDMLELENLFKPIKLKFGV